MTISRPSFFRPLGQRADHVVGLDALDAQQRQAERGNRLDQRRDLRAQVVRHRRPVRLVFLEEVVAESAARRVEHDGDQLRAFFLQQLVQHVEHAEQGAGRLAFRARERRQREERAVQVGRAVHQPELAGLGHGDQRPGGWVAFSSFFSSSTAGTSAPGRGRADLDRRLDALVGQVERAGLAAGRRASRAGKNECGAHRREYRPASPRLALDDRDRQARDADQALRVVADLDVPHLACAGRDGSGSRARSRGRSSPAAGDWR